MPNKRKPASKKKPTRARKLTKKGLGGSLSQREKNRAAKGAMKQSRNRTKKKY